MTEVEGFEKTITEVNSGMIMDDDTLNSCMISKKEWQCPECRKMYSRKQTLRTHLFVAHEIEAGNPAKRYKLYEADTSDDVPKSTHYHRIKSRQTEKSMEPSTSLHNNDDFEERSKLNENQICEDRDQLIEEDMVLEDLSEGDEDQTELYETEQREVEDGKKLLDDNRKNSGGDIPLYVIPPSDNVYQSTVTQFEHLMAVSAFATRHNLSDTAIKDLLNLLQLHLPENNLGITNIRDLKKLCGFDRNYLQYHVFCGSCKKLFSEESDQCETPSCAGSKQNTDNKCYFVTSDLKKQLKEILERNGTWDIIESLSKSSDTNVISDIRSSFCYREMQKPGSFLNNTDNITLSLFIDGVPLFKSSGVSMWPVYLLINELPPKERFLRKNMLLWGIWQGVGKPVMTTFLKPLVMDLAVLYKEGLTITVDEKACIVKAKLIVVTMDLQARAYITNMTQHNGENGCLYCDEPGVVVPSGKATCRSYPARSSNLRTDTDVQAAMHRAGTDGKRVEGFFGESVLCYIPDFSLTNNIVIDYMHGTLLGVTKKLLDLWFDSKYSNAPHYVGKKITVVDKIMKRIQPPYLIHRTPRILSNTYIHWKASELRNWLLFYAVPCLQGVLPEVYLQHFCCLVSSTFILLTEGITELELARASCLLGLFVKEIENLYGPNFLSLNVHNLTHLVDCVKKWGPLWGFSCFPFESFNGEIKRSIHGTGNVCRQIFWTFQAQKRIAQMAGELEAGTTQQYIDGLINDSPKLQGSTEAYKCRVLKMQPLQDEISNDVMNLLEEHLQAGQDRVFFNAPKIVRNGFVMYSRSCTKVNKHNSYTIAIDDGQNSSIEVDSFLVHEQTRRVFAVGKLFGEDGCAVEGRVPHIKLLKRRMDLAVVKAELLREPLVVIKNGENISASCFPNTYERD